MFFNEYLPPVNFRFNVVLLDDVNNSKKNAATKQMASGLKAVAQVLLGESSFASVSGLESEVETEEVKVGGVNYTYNLPTGMKYGTLVLSRGVITRYSALEFWYLQNINEVDGEIEKKHLVISLLDTHSVPIIVWLVIDAYPISWKVNDMDAKNGEILIEEVKLAYSRYEVIKLM